VPGALHQCHHCQTEFRIDVRSFEEHGIVFVTKWQGVGQGYLDEKWRNHIVGPEGPTQAFVYFQAGSICSAFEQSKNEDLDIGSLVSVQDRKELLAPNPNFRA
jgi:hypothetical protein